MSTRYTNKCHCPNASEHGHYVYLLTDRRVQLLNDRYVSNYPKRAISNYMGFSDHPHVRLKNHNREPGYKVGHKSTAATAPFWKTQLMIRFETRQEAVKFKAIWRTKRGAMNRILFGLALAFHFKLFVICHSTSFCRRLYDKYRSVYYQLYHEYLESISQTK
jgi:hypothetical protein